MPGKFLGGDFHIFLLGFLVETQRDHGSLLLFLAVIGREDVTLAEYAENRFFPVEKFEIHCPNLGQKQVSIADSGLPAISKKKCRQKRIGMQ
jgi:hypothetical protein